MKDERFVKTGEDAYRLLNLQQFPNFHESGNIEGMRNRYYGKDAYLVHAGHYIYHVDEDTFRAVKDFRVLLRTGFGSMKSLLRRSTMSA